jgi:hypothetical protein
MARVKMFRRGRNRALAFTTVQELPILLIYCGIGDLSGVVSEAQKNGSPTGHDQDYRFMPENKMLD